MEFNFTNWADPNFYSRKLPSAEEIHSFFNCISLDSPKSEDSFFYKVPFHDYTQQSDSYSSGETYPILEPDSINSNWLVPTLKQLPLDDLSISSCSEYGHENYNESNPILERIPAIAFSLDPEIQELIPRVSAKKSINRQTNIKSLRELSTIKHMVTHFINSFLGYEIEQFKSILQKRGYIQSLNHIEIVQKILKLNKLYPNYPIYILADTPLLDYLLIHSQHLPGQLLRNAWLIRGSRSGYGRNRDNKFSEYKSAIFTTAEMKGGHSFELHHTQQRGHRCWEIYIAFIAKLGFDIPEDPTLETEAVLKTPPTHPRWTDLV